MNADYAIRVENLAKRYRIGQGVRPKYATLRESVVRSLGRPLRALQSGNEREDPAHDLWALDGVTFEIEPGEVVGIIGRNGAGKSTLLKILARITEPTRGTVDLYGRVGSLLEVGTGFHPELTGRENIFLNGAILGMRRGEIERKFDEIVAFAELEKFIDTPVKYYSSGMYMRLAFSVAAHLEPEILLVDEVLAVGDAEFQKKCLGKMGEVARQGRTILFVSHQMNAVQALCPRTLWLADGRLVDLGDTHKIIARYLSTGATQNLWSAPEGGSAVSNPYFDPLRLAIVDGTLRPLAREVSASERFGVLVEGDVRQLQPSTTVGFAVYATSGELLFWSLQTDVPQEQWPKLVKGRNTLVAWIPSHFLNEGDYRIELIVSLHFQEWLSQPGVNAPAVEISIRGELSQSPYWMMARPGLLAPVIPFESIPNQEGVWA